MSKITNLSEPWSNNHSGEEVEDFLKEELATTYAKIAAINNSPIVLVSSLSGVSDPLADTVYRLYNGTSYTDYMYYNSQWVEMAAHDVAGFQPQTSYYICGTASATAAKVIDATSNPNNSHLSAYVLTLGGHFKVKMNNVNTVANATLKVGSAAAKALYYNGVRASATNSWSAGEIIFVYYDGTNYQSYSNNDKINSYLYGDVRTLSIGDTYENGESVISSDKQFLRLTKDILAMSLTETVASGDLRTYNNVTYRSGRVVNAYSSSTNYSSATAEAPVYAIGCPTKFSLTVNSSVTVSFGDGVEELGGTVQLTSGFSSSIIATEIYNLLSSLENTGWTFTNSEDGKITAIPDTAGDYSSYTLSMGGASGIGCTAEYNTDDNENTTSIVFTISVAESVITATFNGTNVNIDISTLTVETTLSAAIATEIYTAFNGTSEWNVSNDGNIIVAECTTAGNNSSVAFGINENTFGITGSLTTICAGSNNVSYYNGTVWNIISAISNYALTAIWSSDGINESWLIANATSQDTDVLRLKKEPIVKKNISLGSTIHGYINSKGVWASSNYHYLIPIDTTLKGSYIITMRPGEATYYAWLKDTSTSGTPSYSDGSTTTTRIAEGSTVEITPPNEESRYLYILYRISSTYYRPQSIVFKYANTIDEINKLRDDVDSINMENVLFPENTEADLVISDENYNDIVQFKNGHIKTKYFDSADLDINSFKVFEFIRNKYNGLRCAIIGDSISTYRGTMPDGYATHYPNGDVNNVKYMWWKITCDVLGMTPVNCAWSGSKVTGAPKGATAAAGCSDKRIEDAGRNGNPDIIIFFISCNDWGHDIPLGTWSVDSTIIDDSEYSASDTISTFRDAYALMLKKAHVAYPQCKLFCCSNLDEIRRDDVGPGEYPPINKSISSGGVSNYTWNQNLKEIAEALGASFIDVHDCGINIFNLRDYYSDDGDLHPNRAGQALIAQKVISALISK